MKKDAKQEFVTRHDLELWGGQLAQQIAEEGRKTRDHFDEKIGVLVEKRTDELLGVSRDEITLLRDTQKAHGERIEVIEKKVGV